MATPFRLKRSAISGKRPELGDLQLGELALNFYDGYLFAKRETNGVGIADTVSLLNPWTENFGGTSIFYEQSVGIGSTSPTEALDVVGVATFKAGDVYIDQRLFVGGIEIGSGGGALFSGITTFSDTTDNTLGDADTGAVQIDGGLGVNKNVTVGAGLSIGTTLNVAGVTTFQGDVLLDGSNTDLVVEGTIRTPNLHSNGSDLTIRGGGNTSSKQSIILSNSGASAMEILGNSSSSGGIILDTRNSGNILLKHNAVTKLTIDSTGIDVNGHSELDTVRITGLSTFTKDVDVNAAIDVDGHTELDELNVAGIATFANVTDNTLGDSNTGAIQIDGGLGVDKNVTIGGNLNVQGYSELVGVVTFKGGTINIGDANTDDVNVGGEFISSLIPNDDDSYDLGSDSKQWRNIYINGQAEIDDLNVSGITTTVLFNVGVGGTVITTTETGLVGINSTAPTTTLDVDGTINSSTDVTINGTSVLTTATNDAVALAIALG